MILSSYSRSCRVYFEPSYQFLNQPVQSSRYVTIRAPAASSPQLTTRPEESPEPSSKNGKESVLRFWRQYMETRGKPISIYLDRHSTYKQNAKKNILDNPEALTQFERAMKELSIEIIHAYSPQAKGRVERLFETLQDRLVKELRLRGISDVEEANLFLLKTFIPDFNAKFGVPPKSSKDLHRPLRKDEVQKLDSIFAIRETRAVLNDFTVRYKNNWLQLAKSQPALVCRKDKVEIEERMDGSMHIVFRGKELSYEALPERPRRLSEAPVMALTKERKPWTPPPDHPWRQKFLKSKVVQTNSAK